MTEDMTQAAGDAAAFEDLRAEISLMRRAIEGLTAARERVPDYTPTLADMANQLTNVLAALERIAKAPAVSLTPVDLARQINASATQARAEDARKLDEARDTISRSIGRIDGMIARGQSVEGQRRRLIWCCAGSAVGAIILWCLLVRAIAG
ncbi:hypothetical protein [Sphingomonas kyeonggiensis]|uniref:Uncharacterized protein n=1 Tax=Sphingomonas kyeonggiensis TaxID=1268553 RepID=A0A7W6JVX9_9SPHN|nr:hypothetical protein [Sphingomonas kyeonggiensis]MBB4099481.1 hypothetical protein [Sphingomonas kyeonggiensis]